MPQAYHNAKKNTEVAGRRLRRLLQVLLGHNNHVHLVGHSLGARVCLEVRAQHSHRSRSKAHGTTKSESQLRVGCVCLTAVLRCCCDTGSEGRASKASNWQLGSMLFTRSSCALRCSQQRGRIPFVHASSTSDCLLFKERPSAPEVPRTPTTTQPCLIRAQ